jgi:superfamily II DNA helicase RecQ
MLCQGCDLRNIIRIILWGLPPTFCALVQRAGRAARDFATLGETILIVPKSVLKDGVSNEDLNDTVGNAAIDAEALNREPQQQELTETIVEILDEEGIRIVDESDSVEEESIGKVKRTKKLGKDTHIREVRALSAFVTTKDCRRKIWDAFFENDKKCK